MTSSTETKSPAQTSARPRVIIIGGGFGGLYAAKALSNQPVDVTLIRNRQLASAP